MTSRPERVRMPSIRDVARVAGVSHQTVSRVLNEYPGIRPDTRRRVLEAMASLDYRPNRAARVLATSRSGLVGVLATVNGSYYGPSSSLNAIEDAGRDAGYATVLTSAKSTDADALAEAVGYLVGEGVEGIIALAPQTRAAAVLSGLRDPLPAVILQADGHGSESGLSVDNELGAATAVRHLLDLGHRRIGMVQGPPDWAESGARYRGFIAAMAERGRHPIAVAAGDWTAESGYRAFSHLRGAEVTSVFCANDQMALGLIHAASDRGLRVPRDLSVVGFDDVPESAHYLPPLTTIRQDFAELGRRAIATLLAWMAGVRADFPAPIAPRLVVRASTMPVRR